MMRRMPLAIVLLLSALLPLGCNSDDISSTKEETPTYIDPDCLTSIKGLKLEGPIWSTWAESGTKSTGGIFQFVGETVEYRIDPEWRTSTPPDCDLEIDVQVSGGTETAISSAGTGTPLHFSLTALAAGVHTVRFGIQTGGESAYTSSWITTRIADRPEVAGIEFRGVDASDEPFYYRNLGRLTTEPAVYVRESEDRVVEVKLLTKDNEALPDRLLHGSYSIQFLSADESVILATQSAEDPTQFTLHSAGNGETSLTIRVLHEDGNVELEIADLPAFAGKPRWVERFHAGNAPDGPIYQVVVFDDQLIVMGYFDNVGELPAHHIARWDGRSWTAMGEGVAFGGRMIADETTLLVGSPQGGFVRWNGSAWETHAPPVPVGGPPAAAVLLGGELYAGSQIQRWDGKGWLPGYSADGFDGATDLVTSEDKLYVAANFDRLSSSPRRWSSVAQLTFGEPTIWQELSKRTNKDRVSFIGGAPSDLAIGWIDHRGIPELGSIEVVRGTHVTTVAEGLKIAIGVARADDDLYFADRKSVYSQAIGFDVPLGTANGNIHDLVLFRGDLFVVGAFGTMSGVPSYQITMWTD